ncbi:type II toxin-antitoxin system Xre/ParS family antitoxin [Marivirga sp.]|uniref:type II RES/Xre toxin-antitoxin system antitoxin n=1 Tax=Marivirga sp. TaxID=2018662 RepID=UPI002D7E73E0|nr:antitoxin Xre/MbcA/ParS toxin-binding domain-containing protein [Marivirga sp.]HET8860049.1 antitoxin Xre/MbcA/ParS toxin-binding domain-containing protein [Marivirga sp.]
MNNSLKTTTFNTKSSIEKAQLRKKSIRKWTLKADGKTFIWSNRLERVEVIRAGIPYGSLEFISKKINHPVKVVLNIVGVPQTTYNKKKGNHSLLDSRDSELVLSISELVDFGIEIFNNEEEKFQRWLNKPNISLGGTAPIKFLDTISGINEVKFCLTRIEHGNFA